MNQRGLAGMLLVAVFGAAAVMDAASVVRARMPAEIQTGWWAHSRERDREFRVTDRAVTPAVPERACPRGHAGQIRIFADSQGRFSVRGSINGKAVTFVVDSSLEGIRIGDRTARRVGAVIQRGKTLPLIDSGGRVLANVTVLQQMRIDGWSWERIPAWIVARSETEVRLGRRFLDQFQVRTAGNSLILERCR